jgi:hypothetical protein
MPATTGIRRTLLRPAHAILIALVLAVALLTAVSPAADAAHKHKTGWDCLAHYESTHRWNVNTGNGHYGGLQFSYSTWKAYGGPQWSGNKYPHQATRAEQIHVAKRVAYMGYKKNKPQGGRNAWPNTWRKCF